MALAPFRRKLTIQIVVTQIHITQVWVYTKSFSYVSSKLVLFEPNLDQASANSQACWNRTSEIVDQGCKIFKSST